MVSRLLTLVNKLLPITNMRPRLLSARRWCLVHSRILAPSLKQHCRLIQVPKAQTSPASQSSARAGKHTTTPYLSVINGSLIHSDWGSNDEFFKFTRGRFVVDEAENLRRREVRFDLSQLARVAADSVGAAQCVSIKKYPDGMFNKAFLLSMEDGREVVAKVPNPNAGIPHFTTASEVATMDFVSPFPTPSIPSLANVTHLGGEENS